MLLDRFRDKNDATYFNDSNQNALKL